MRDFSYLDPSENVQGPFCELCMQKFYEHGFFPIDIAIHVQQDSVAEVHTLESLIHLNDINFPFRFPDSEPHSPHPCSNPHCALLRLPSISGSSLAPIDSDRVGRAQIALEELGHTRTLFDQKDDLKKKTICSLCSINFTSPYNFWKHVFEKHSKQLSEGVSPSESFILNSDFDQLETLLKNLRLESILAQRLSLSSRKTADTQEKTAAVGPPSPAVYYPFVELVAPSTPKAVPVSHLANFLIGMRNAFKSRAMASITLYLTRIGWQMLECRQCDSRFPSFAHVLEHLMSPKHLAKVFGEDGSGCVRSGEAERLAEFMRNILASCEQTAAPPATPSPMPPQTSRLGLVPLHCKNIESSELDGRLLEIERRNLLNLFKKTDRELISLVFADVLDKMKKNTPADTWRSCAFCSKFLTNALNLVSHTLSSSHMQAVMENGGCSKADVRFWKDRLNKCIKGNKLPAGSKGTPAPVNKKPATNLPPTGPVTAKVTSIYSWQPSALPLLTPDATPPDEKTVATNSRFLSETDIYSEIDKIRKQFWSVSGEDEFNRKYASKMTQKSCGLCQVALKTPFETVEHLVSTLHATKIFKCCRVVQQDIDAWMNTLKGSAVPPPPVRSAGFTVRGNGAAVNVFRTFTASRQFTPTNQLPLSFARKDVHDALTDAEYAEFLDFLRSAHSKYNVNKIAFFNPDVAAMKFCSWCNAQCRVPVNVISHLLSKKHIEQMVQCGHKVTRRDVEYWKGYILKAGLKNKPVH